MKRTIFYSWQSDLPSIANRNLIEDSLQRALKAIRRDESESIDPVLDRDTSGVPGSPAIAESIFAKIVMADLFVADVSIINDEFGGRLTPNPNVLIELGYAVAQLGWDRVLLVLNVAHGGPEVLPFDLRGRRIVPYEAPVASFDKAEVRGLLQGRLEASLRDILSTETYNSLPSGPNALLWWGNWSFGKNDEAYGGDLFVRELGSDGFLFDLSVFNGAHSGAVSAYARLASKDLAYARIRNGDEPKFGEIAFRRSVEGCRRTVELTETASCHYHRGMRAHFGGVFEKTREPWFDAGLMNELELCRLHSMTGEHFDKIKACTMEVGTGDNSDEFEARVLTGGVAGLYTIMESIVMLGPRGELWAAYIDGNCVRYFSNQEQWKGSMPKTIAEWKSRFSDKAVVFHSSVGSISRKILPTMLGRFRSAFPIRLGLPR